MDKLKNHLTSCITPTFDGVGLCFFVPKRFGSRQEKASHVIPELSQHTALLSADKPHQLSSFHLYFPRWGLGAGIFASFVEVDLPKS